MTTGAKRIEFETAYAKVSSQLDKLEPILGEQVKNMSPPALFQPDLDAFSEVQSGPAADTLRLGTDLIAEIQSEPDFPTTYLTNVSAKVEQLRGRLRLVEASTGKLHERAEYAASKARFYAEFDDLGGKVQGLESWLASLDVGGVDAQACGRNGGGGGGGGSETLSAERGGVGGNGGASSSPSWSSARALEQLEQCTKRKALLTSFGHVISEMKRLAGEVTLHPGAAEDPANTIKADVYQFCDRWEAVEKEFARKEALLISRATGAKEHEAAVEESRAVFKCSSDMMLSAPIYVRDADSMQDEIRRLKERLKRTSGGGGGSGSSNSNAVLNSVAETQVSSGRKAVEARIESLEAELQKLTQFDEEVEGISRWMQEVDAFLCAEEPAVGDRATLEAQLKESNALQDDIDTLNPNMSLINETGQQLLNKCAPTESFRNSIQHWLSVAKFSLIFTHLSPGLYLGIIYGAAMREHMIFGFTL